MGSTVIKVDGLSKQYRLGNVGTGSLTTDFKRWWHLFRGKEDPFLKIGEENDRTRKGSSDFVWALRDISFTVEQGDVVGIIGRNGAGKSTLLKILSRTTLPTAGSIKIKGRIASLLEVGTGFHPELSGKENIYLNGSILGMSKKEIKRKFDEIINFAGVDRYVDTPVKRYSSGMYVRLAFAVAAHLDPEILIVDEVLAVGDADFQKKALGKMNEVSKGEGRTVLFVSHNMGAIRQLCQKGILLNNGSIEALGQSDDVIKHYFNYGHDLNVKPPIDAYRRYDISESPIVIEDIYVNNQEDYFPTLPIGSQPEIVIRLLSKTSISLANVTISFYNAEGLNIGMAFSLDDNFNLNVDRGLHELIFKLNGPKFSPGRYFIGVGINQSTKTLAWDGVSYYPIFNIENQYNVTHFSHRPWGVNHLDGNVWTVKKV